MVILTVISNIWCCKNFYKNMKNYADNDAHKVHEVFKRVYDWILINYQILIYYKK